MPKPRTRTMRRSLPTSLSVFVQAQRGQPSAFRSCFKTRAKQDRYRVLGSRQAQVLRPTSCYTTTEFAPMMPLAGCPGTIWGYLTHLRRKASFGLFGTGTCKTIPLDQSRRFTATSTQRTAWSLERQHHVSRTLSIIENAVSHRYSSSRIGLCSKCGLVL